MIIKPYITFDGQAEEALNYYKSVFNGTIENLFRYGDAPTTKNMPPLDEACKNRIANARLDFGSNKLNVCDKLPHQPLTVGNNVHIDIMFFDDEIVKQIFDSLVKGGQVIVPLSKVPFSPNYGKLVDKFGINWSVMQIPNE